MPKYKKVAGPNIEGVELTQEGMHAIFARMGYPDITSGTIYNGAPTINTAKLNQQGFMPILTGVGPRQTSGHWIMLIKGQGNNYYLFDPLGKAAGMSYQNILSAQLPGGSQLTVLPNQSGLNMGLCGYWVASAGLRAMAALNPARGAPDLVAVGQAITHDMTNELAGNGYHEITGWLGAVAKRFPGTPDTDPQPNATALRHATEQGLQIPDSVNVDPTIEVRPVKPLPEWEDFSLYTDETVRDALKYANDHYLNTRYTGKVESEPAEMYGITVYRQVHGLGHTARTMAYAQIIVEEARKAQLRGEKLQQFKDGRTIADVTPEELKKIMIAQAFFVTGRDDEESALNYAKYHEQSKTAFLAYVKANESTLIPAVFKDQKDVDFYADVIEDKNHIWNASPAHVLINQGHMVDLVRVKQPPESFLESYFRALQPWLGTKGAEAVFAKQREFFNATYERVAPFDSNNKEPHLITSGYYQAVRGANGKLLRYPATEVGKDGDVISFPPTYKLKDGETFENIQHRSGRFVIDADGNVIRHAPKKGEKEGSPAQFSSTYRLKDNERFMRVDEYLQLPDVQSRFPGVGKHLEGGLPGMKFMDYERRLNSREKGRCETEVDYCLGQLQSANNQIKLATVKAAFQPSSTKTRRAANADELAAAQIIKQILADPDTIKKDHVEINGRRLDEAFFRELLKKCDMALVGAALGNQDLTNIDQMMRHEKDVTFHSTGTPVETKNISEMWANEYRKNGKVSVRDALVHMMQDESWYYTRINAIAQARDTGSSFKEVLLTSLLIPSTQKAIVETQPRQVHKAPQTIYKGMQLPQEKINELISKSEAIIANMELGLFSDTAAKAYETMAINNFSDMLARTCLSTSVEMKASEMFGNFVFEVNDPDELLDPKRIGVHVQLSEAEYSIYLPDDVVLVPMKVTRGKSGSPDIVSLIAVKTPDFARNYESGFAVAPYLAMQIAPLNAAKDAVDQAIAEVTFPHPDPFDSVLLTLPNLAASAAKDTFAQTVRDCKSALQDNDADAMRRALARIPSDQQIQGFIRGLNYQIIQSEVESMKELLNKKIILQGNVLPALEQCKTALQVNDINNALIAIQSLPKEQDLNAFGALKRQLTELQLGLTISLTPLQNAVNPTGIYSKKQEERYNLLLDDLTKRLTAFEKTNPSSIEAVANVTATLTDMSKEIEFFRAEKNKMPAKPVDMSDIDLLEGRIQAVSQKLFDTVHGITERRIELMVNKASFHKYEPEAQQGLAVLTELEKTLGNSSEAGVKKAAVTLLKNAYEEKQKQYPQMVQLNLKSEALITQLRTRLNMHEEHVEAQKPKPATGVYGLFGWAIGGVVNTADYYWRPDYYKDLDNKTKALDRFKTEINDKGTDAATIISQLATKSPDQLQDWLELPPKEARELHAALSQIEKKGTAIETQSELLDEVLGKLDKLSPELRLDIGGDYGFTKI